MTDRLLEMMQSDNPFVFGGSGRGKIKQTTRNDLHGKRG